MIYWKTQKKWLSTGDKAECECPLYASRKGEVKYMLRTIQYSFPSKADGLEISCLAVVPELERNEKYRGIIQIVHGMSEYKDATFLLWNIWQSENI